MSLAGARLSLAVAGVNLAGAGVSLAEAGVNLAGAGVSLTGVRLSLAGAGMGPTTTCICLETSSNPVTATSASLEIVADLGRVSCFLPEMTGSLALRFDTACNTVSGPSLRKALTPAGFFLLTTQVPPAAVSRVSMILCAARAILPSVSYSGA